MQSNRFIGWTHALALIVLLSGAPTAGVAQPAGDLTSALSVGDRSDGDKARDAGRKPGEVVVFLGITRGMTVVDLIASGGYYTEVLSVAVGPTGKVYAQNNEFVLKMREGANEKAMTARLADGRLPNVERLDREMHSLGLERNSIDAAVTALNFHDIANGRGPEAVAGFLGAIREFLKPGAVLGLIDHDGDAEKDNTTLHRIPEADVVRAVEKAGFEVVEKGQMLRNPADDHSLGVFDPTIRGATDRFVLKLRNPQ